MTNMYIRIKLSFLILKSHNIRVFCWLRNPKNNIFVISLGNKQAVPRPGGEQWSGEATRNQGLLVEETRVDVSIGETTAAPDAPRKERPVWMMESTVMPSDQVTNYNAFTIRLEVVWAKYFSKFFRNRTRFINIHYNIFWNRKIKKYFLDFVFCSTLKNM